MREEVNLLDTTISDLLERQADEPPSQKAIVYLCYSEFGDALNIRWIYQKYRGRANQVLVDGDK
jgi:fatty-acyl-CoA synthase